MYRRILLVAALFIATLPGAVLAQSQLARQATPLTAGENRGAADSFQGDHAWYFIAKPGHFHVDFTLGALSGDSALGGRPQVGMVFAIRAKDHSFTQHSSSDGVTFDGSTKTEVKVYMLVQPAGGSLVRTARNYTITASGDVTFGGEQGGATDGIVGAYISKRNDYGATRFAADGNITTSTGATGRWHLFDPDSHLYTIQIGNDRFTAKLVPGRGLIDPTNDYTLFEPSR